MLPCLHLRLRIPCSQACGGSVINMLTQGGGGTVGYLAPVSCDHFFQVGGRGSRQCSAGCQRPARQSRCLPEAGHFPVARAQSSCRLLPIHGTREAELSATCPTMHHKCRPPLPLQYTWWITFLHWFVWLMVLIYLVSGVLHKTR